MNIVYARGHWAKFFCPLIFSSWEIFIDLFFVYFFVYTFLHIVIFSSSHIFVLLFFRLDIISTALLFVHADFHKQDQNTQNLCIKTLNPHPIPITHGACKATRKVREPIQKQCAAKISSKPTFSNVWNQISQTQYKTNKKI